MMSLISGRSLSWVAAALLLAAPRPALAVEGVPPFSWVALGPLAPELSVDVSFAPQFGVGSGFTGGEAERHLQAKRYLVCPLLVRYGLFPRLEAYGAFPYFWGTSPQRSVAYLAGNPQELAGTVAGSDFGDGGLGARLRVMGDPEESHELIASFGLVIPLGTNVWQWLRYSFQGWLDVPEDLATGDGAWKMLFGIQHSWCGPVARVDSMAGYLLKLPLEVTSMGIGFGSSVNVSLGSPVLAIVRPEIEIARDLMLTGRIDGFWAPAGRASGGGFLADDPVSMDIVLGSYSNLVLETGALWAGGGIRWRPSDVYELRLEALAPVAVRRAYRTWRVGCAASYLWSPK